MYSHSNPIVDTPEPDKTFDSLELSMEDTQTQENPLPPLLPRSAWNSQVAFLRALFRAKKALDKIEQEAGILRD